MSLFRKSTAIVGTLAAIMLAQQGVAAPRSWLLPSDVTFDDDGDAWVTVDAATSSDLYYPDHNAQAVQPQAYAPDGTPVEVEHLSKGQLRSTFDLHLTQKGTYKIAVVSSSVMGSYMLNGERKMLPRGTTPATLAQAIPQGATDVMSAENVSRVETFATAGEPTMSAFKPSGKGLEMVPLTNPTDLAVGEAATFQFLMNGKPAAGLDVTAVNGGVRYSDGLKQMSAKTDAEGKVTLTWPEAGMWWVNASVGGRREGFGGPGGPGGQQGGGEGGQQRRAPGGGEEGGQARSERAQGEGGQGRPGGEGQGEGPPRPMGPPQPRASYSMTVQVLG